MMTLCECICCLVIRENIHDLKTPIGNKFSSEVIVYDNMMCVRSDNQIRHHKHHRLTISKDP